MGAMVSIDEKTLERVEAFHRDGWSFRVKTVNGVSYLSVRRGGVERGLGRLTPELREYIDRLKEARETPRDVGAGGSLQTDPRYYVTLFPTLDDPAREMTGLPREEVESILFDLRFERAKVKAVECHYVRDGFCMYWGYARESRPIISLYGRFAGGGYALPAFSDPLKSEECDRVMLRVNELLCFDCGKYRPRIDKEKNT